MPSFRATYELQAESDSDAEQWAKSVAREQSIECIDDAVPHQWILDEILAKVASIEKINETTYSAKISFNADITGNELPMLLNVLYGNTSLHVGVKLVDVDFDEQLLKAFPGPRFGIEGVRAATGRSKGPLICAVLKPMGQSTDELAELAYLSVLGGADMVKDDHNLAMQQWAPYRERVEKVAAAVKRGNNETGRSTIYAPSMLCPIDKIEERATFAMAAGATGYLLMPGHTSWDSLRFLASRDDLSLPIMCHPSGLGSFSISPTNGISQEMIYSVYPRLAGADISIFTSFGGRYGFSREICMKVAQKCRDTAGLYRPIFPSPGGGMRLDLAPALKEMYGDDAVFLFGGAAMKYRDKIAEGLRQIRAALTE